MARRTHPDSRLRQQLAQEAAKLMSDTGLRDFALAKRKAAEKLHLPHNTRNLPSNQDIEQALMAYQRLFRGTSQAEALQGLRQNALHAMRLLETFRPRLVGAVLYGSADEHSPINLHLFAHTAEEVGLFLMEQNIPCQLDDRRVKFSPGRFRSLPVYRFVAGEHKIELTVFPYDDIRQAPLSPVDGRPMARADIDEVKRLINAHNAAH